MSKEQTFFQALQNIFVGAQVEGESGFVNLMRIKSRYYERGVFPHLKHDIDEALRPFPDFREELFDRLYTFFRRYFSESGSIYFRFTPPHEHVHEKIYTDDRDIMLFWKTHMLYYVKTDRLFQSMRVEVGGFRFFFDVSKLQHKRANEKRTLVYSFKELQQNGTLVFRVDYSEKGRQTNVDAIRRTLRAHIPDVPSEETLERAFRVFERQSEVDFFINKNARKFLQEQFDLWLYQYVFEPAQRNSTLWSEMRIRQLQVLKAIAYKIIDFIAQFEDELARIWNKPRFVLESHYVITLDRIAAQERGWPVLKRLLTHPNIERQIREWRELGIVGEDFEISQVLIRGSLSERYQHLPVDTQHFPDLEMSIISLFDHLDRQLDGWLVHSENYQALRTLLPKFRKRVQTIYIDPPFNKEQDADYLYSVKYKDSTWATFLENRLSLARQFLRDQGSIFVRCDHNGNYIVRSLMNHIFGTHNFRNEIIVRRGAPKAGLISQFKDFRAMTVAYDNLYWYSCSEGSRYKGFYKEASAEKKSRGFWADFQKGEAYDRPTMRYEILGLKIDKGQWKWRKERAYKAVENYAEFLRIANETGESLEQYWMRTGQCLEFIKRDGNKIKYWVHPREELLVDNNWLDIPGYSSNWGFQTENSEILLMRAIEGTSEKGDVVMDFFLGSGTTAAVAHRLERRWLGIEMGDHFQNIVLPRLKKALTDPTPAGGGHGGEEQPRRGGFFKYFRLEQYDEILRKACYRDDDTSLFHQQDPYTQYVFQRDPKMLDNAETGEQVMDIDKEQHMISVKLDRLYPSIDLSETISCLVGKSIRRIHPDSSDCANPAAVEFEDGTVLDIQSPDWHLLKPLLWW